MPKIGGIEFLMTGLAGALSGKNIEEFSINEMNEIWDEIKTNSN